MKNTKQKITESARKLFNQQGFSQVTLRMIANDLGMSCGNLNYHFKKREDILEYLYFEMVAVFDKRVADLPKQKISMTHIYQEIELSMLRMLDYRFFWTDIYNLLRLSPTIKAHFLAVYQKRIEGYLYLFETLKKQGLLKDSMYHKSYQFIGKQMLNYSNTWLYTKALYAQDAYQDERRVQREAQTLLAMLYPYLTSKGQEELEAVIPEFFKDKETLD